MRLLFLMTGVQSSGGGIASVNRNVLRAFSDWAGSSDCLCGDAVYLSDRRVHDASAWSHCTQLREIACGGSRVRFILAAIRCCIANRPTLVFVDHLHLASVAFLLRLVAGPYVLFCHGVEFDGAISFLRRTAFRRARMRLSNSRFTARRLMGKFPGIDVIPCELGVEDRERPEPSERMPALADGSGTVRAPSEIGILIVGRMNAAERYKGHDELLRAFEKIASDFADAQLWIVGEGDDLPRIKSDASKTACADRILFSGFVSARELELVFSRCRVFAMPSRGEGFGLVYLEAMRHAKPCIGSTRDAGSEVIVENQTGLLVDPEDINALAGALRRLLEDRRFAQCLGENGRRRLQSNFQFHHFRDRLKACLQTLVPALTRVQGSRMSEVD